jgi:hypothetical protein
MWCKPALSAGAGPWIGAPVLLENSWSSKAVVAMSSCSCSPISKGHPPKNIVKQLKNTHKVMVCFWSPCLKTPKPSPKPFHSPMRSGLCSWKVPGIGRQTNKFGISSQSKHKAHTMHTHRCTCAKHWCFSAELQASDKVVPVLGKNRCALGKCVSQKSCL